MWVNFTLFNYILFSVVHYRYYSETGSNTIYSLEVLKYLVTFLCFTFYFDLLINFLLMIKLKLIQRIKFLQPIQKKNVLYVVNLWTHQVQLLVGIYFVGCVFIIVWNTKKSVQFVGKMLTLVELSFYRIICNAF